MGDAADFNCIESFLKSQSGKERLSAIRRSLIGNRVVQVEFENNTCNIKTLLTMENGGRFYAIQPCHDVDVIRELFEEKCQLS